MYGRRRSLSFLAALLAASLAAGPQAFAQDGGPGDPPAPGPGGPPGDPPPDGPPPGGGDPPPPPTPPPPLSVSLNVAVPQVVLGKDGSARATASGGVPPYRYDFFLNACPPGPEEAILPVEYPDTIRPCGSRTGTVQVRVVAHDDAGQTAEATDSYTVVGPNGDSCTPNASEPTPGDDMGT